VVKDSTIPAKSSLGVSDSIRGRCSKSTSQLNQPKSAPDSRASRISRSSHPDMPNHQTFVKDSWRPERSNTGRSDTPNPAIKKDSRRQGMSTNSRAHSVNNSQNVSNSIASPLDPTAYAPQERVMEQKAIARGIRREFFQVSRQCPI
jgi:hypothetical protein